MKMNTQVPQDNINPTVVAVDKDKNGLPAARWALEHLLISNQILILIHVRTRNSVADGGLVDDIFMPLRVYCARRGVTVEEVVLEGNDIHSTILDYINKHHVTRIVLGASSRNPLARKFWRYNVPAMVNKGAPEFCSVYIIMKGKALAMRQPGACSTPPRLPVPSPQNSTEFAHSESEDGSRQFSVKGDEKNAYSPQEKENNDDGLWSRNSSTVASSRGQRRNFFVLADSMDITQVEIKGTRRIRDIAADPESNSVLSELQRLQLEVKQTMNMYNTACKNAITSQQKVDELKKLNQDETNRIEQAKLAEEAALAQVEMEKEKCRAAVEAAERAQKIAEREMQRRVVAEKKAKRESMEKIRALDAVSNNDVRYRKYTIEEIQEATDKFSRSMKIGEGGYGPVFKGKLDHTPVAIKVLRADAAQGRRQFQQEIEVLSCMRHPNMVLLMGACPEYGCLVYEFMDNGSLEDRLFRKGNTLPIPWGIRFKIAADIATGLLFLHQAKPEPLVHRDLKPANILLNRSYTCKISDVGLARLVPPSIADSVTQYHMTSAAGTFCYIDPEYQQTGKLGAKSDIYSLGVLLLQIITARPPMGLTHHVQRAIEKDTFADMLDPAVPDWPVEDTLGYAKLALKCTELRKKDRPDLGTEILPELNRIKELGMQHGLVHWHAR